MTRFVSYLWVILLLHFLYGTVSQSDLCQNANGGCMHICTPMLANSSHECSCYTGYYLGSDNTSCIDINECTTNTDACEIDCFNHIGSYTCDCIPGCTLDENGFTCTDIDECALGISGCNQNCTNVDCTNGRYKCSCLSGYYIFSDNHTCIDLNECEDSPCEQDCENKEGSFTCACQNGCLLNDDQLTCSDIDECQEGTSGCNHNCTNLHCTEDRYYCSCDPGYQLSMDNHTCIDINECDTGSHNCDHSCVNLPGTYYCQCDAGCLLDSNGYSCYDIDECEAGLSDCEQNCTNKGCRDGYFECTCYDGYNFTNTNDNITCTDIDECEVNNGGCDTTCINLVPHYRCECNRGYYLDEDMLSCMAEACPTLVAPANGSIVCTGPQVTNESCQFFCDSGFSLSGMDYRECQSDNTWSGEDDIACLPYACEELETIDGTLLILPCNSIFPSECTYVCDDGYRLADSGRVQELECVSVSDPEKFVDWTTLEQCTAYDICEEGTCQNGGTCYSWNDRVMCKCASEYVGDICETRVLQTPVLPILEVFEQSEDLFINANTSTVITVTITADPDVQFVPSNILEITPEKGYVSFYVLPLRSGIFTMEYDVVSASNAFQKPKDDYLIVYSTTTTSTYFEKNGLETGIVGPGCCSRDTGFHHSYCTATNRKVLLSSSCGWEQDDETLYRTKGLTFIHSGGVALPLSVSTLDAILSSSVLDVSISNVPNTCSQCTDGSLADAIGGTCYDWDLVVTDTREMVQSGSLLKTLLHHMDAGLPSNLIINSTERSQQLRSYDHTASLMEASSLHDLSGCESLPQPLDGLVYIVRSHASLRIDVGSDSISLENSADWNPLCFAVSICQLPQTPLYISIPVETRDIVTGFQFFQPYVQEGWTITSRSAALSYYGVSSFSKEWFWNGTHLISLNVPYYDTSLWVTAEGRMSHINHVIDFSFSGYFYSIIGYDIKVPQKFNGDCSIVITMHFDDDTRQMILKSSSTSGVFLNDANLVYNGDQLVKGAGLDLMYATASQDELFQMIFPTNGAGSCLASVYVHYNDFIVPQWTSLYTSCIDIHMGNLIFSGLASQLMIPASTNSAPGATDIVISVWSSNPSNKMIQFGRFFSIPPFSSKGAYLQINLTTNRKLTGLVQNSLLSLFDTNALIETMNIADNALTFQTDIWLFNRYQTVLSGEMTLDTFTLNVAGSMKSLAQEIEEYIHSVMRVSSQFIMARQQVDAANQQGTAARLAFLESDIISKQANYDALTQEYDLLLLNLAELSGLKKMQETSFFDLVSAGIKSQVDALCSVEKCETMCQFDSNATVCVNANITIPISVPCTIIANDSVKVLAQGSKTVLYCENIENCDTNIDIRWAKVDIDSHSLPVPFSTLIRQCSNSCNIATREETAIELQNQDFVRDISSLCVTQYYIANLSHTCWESENHTCTYFIDEEPCWTENEACTDQKLKAALELSTENIESLEFIYYDYKDFQSREISVKAQVYEKSLEREIAFQEWNLAKDELESAKILNDLSISSSGRINGALDFLYHNWLQEYGNPANIIRINSLKFSTIITTQSPSILSILVNYTIPFLSQTNIITLSIDFSTSYEEIREVFLEEVVMRISDAQGRKRSLSKRATQETSVLQFQTNCVDIDRMLNYLGLLNDSIGKSSLTTSLFSTEYIDSVLDTLESDLNKISIDSQNIANEYRDVLIANQQQYLEFAQALYSNLSDQSVADADFTHWLKTTELYHNDVVIDPQDQCFNLIDCLYLVLEHSTVLLDPLAKVDATAASLQSSIPHLYQELLLMATSLDTNFPSINKTISSIYDLVWGIRSLNYWCSSEPIITTHPDPEVHAALGDTVMLSCKATSNLPLAYRWLKNDVLIDGYSASKLVIANFQESDVANYTCQAISNVSCVSSLPSIVQLYDPPVFISVPADYATYAGDELGVKFECEAESYPSPYWNWYYSSDGDTWSLVPNAISNVLTIDKPDHSHEGWYQCEAKNEFTSTQSEPIRLTILNGAVSRKSYPIQAAIDYTPPQYASSGSGDVPEPATNLTQIANTIIQWLQYLIADTTADITNFEIDLTSESRIVIYFNLNTKSISSNYVNSLEVLAPYYLNAIRDLEAAKELLKDKIQDGAVFLPNAIYVFIPDSYQEGPVTFVCPTGHELHFNYLICLPCLAGHYLAGHVVDYRSREPSVLDEALIPVCSPCPVGSYQSEQGSTECITCPEYFTTIGEGSTECENLCPPNTYSYNGIQPCAACESRSYQPEYGATKCLVCDFNPSDLDVCYTYTETSTPMPSPTEMVTVRPTQLTLYEIIEISVGGAVLITLIILLLIVAMVVCTRVGRRLRKRRAAMKGLSTTRSHAPLLANQRKANDIEKAAGMAKSTSLLEMKELDSANKDNATSAEDSAHDDDDDDDLSSIYVETADASTQVNSPDLKPLLGSRDVSLTRDDDTSDSSDSDDSSTESTSDGNSSSSSASLAIGIKSQRGRLESLVEVENEAYASQEKLEDKHIVVETLEMEPEEEIPPEELCTMIVRESISSALEAVTMLEDSQEKTVIIDCLELDQEELQSHQELEDTKLEAEKINRAADEEPVLVKDETSIMAEVKDGISMSDEIPESVEHKETRSEGSDEVESKIEDKGEDEFSQVEEQGTGEDVKTEVEPETNELHVEAKTDATETHAEPELEMHKEEVSDVMVIVTMAEDIDKDGSPTDSPDPALVEEDDKGSEPTQDATRAKYMESEDGVVTAIFGDLDDVSDSENDDEATTLV